MSRFAAVAAAVFALSATGSAETKGPEVSLEEKLLATISEGHDPSVTVRGRDGKDAEVGGAFAVFSPDGRRAAYLGIENNRRFAVIDGQKGEEFMFADSLKFSPDGKRVLYRAGNRVNDGKAEKWWIVEGGKRGPEYDLVGPAAFSPDGSHVAYWANKGSRLAADGSYEGGRWEVNVDGGQGAQGNTFPEADCFTPPTFCDGSGVALAFCARRAGGAYVVYVAGRLNGDFDMADSPQFGCASSIAAWGAIKDGRARVICGEREVGEEAGNAGVPVFDSSGKDFYWVGRKAGKLRVWYRGKPVGGEYEALTVPVAGGRNRVAFCGNRGGVSGAAAPPGAPDLPMRGSLSLCDGGRWVLVVNGEEAPVTWDAADTPVFSPDGERVAYRARAGKKWRIVTGATTGVEADDVSAPAFSADGKKVAYGARIGRELWWKVADMK